MKKYRWEKVEMTVGANCERCGQKISVGETAWERTGWLSFSEYEAEKDHLDPVYFRTSHFIPPPGKIIQDKPRGVKKEKLAQIIVISGKKQPCLPKSTDLKRQKVNPEK